MRFRNVLILLLLGLQNQAVLFFLVTAALCSRISAAEWERFL